MRFIIKFKGFVYDEKFHPNEYIKSEDQIFISIENKDMYTMVSCGCYKCIDELNEECLFEADFHPDDLMSIYEHIYNYGSDLKYAEILVTERYEKKKDSFLLYIYASHTNRKLLRKFYEEFTCKLYDTFKCKPLLEQNLIEDNIKYNVIVEIEADVEFRQEIERALADLKINEIGIEWTANNEINAGGLGDEIIKFVSNSISNIDISRAFDSLIVKLAVDGASFSIRQIAKRLKKECKNEEFYRTELLKRLPEKSEIGSDNVIGGRLYSKDIVSYYFIRYNNKKPSQFYKVEVNIKTKKTDYFETNSKGNKIKKIELYTNKHKKK